MKRIIHLSMILMAVVGISSCGDKESGKSKACDIEQFAVAGEAWNISGSNITKVYPKGTNVGNLIPTIKVSAGASVEPPSGVPQNFSDNSAITYTVTAEDGKTTKSYTAQASVN